MPSGQSDVTADGLDVITIGRSSVDLYGKQIGSRLEDISSFAKSVGGSPTNIAIGAARLGLRAAVITGVGDEAMGRFIREQLAREGVVTRGVKVDKDRLTALVLLAVENDTTFPLIFYRENCADMGLGEADIDPAFIASAKAVLVTGTHFSQANTDAAQRKAIRLARAAGRRVAFDIDYRPNLWGLAGHAAGEERYIKSDRVSHHLQTVLADCDLIVGTEEEIRIAGGGDDVHAALVRIRAITTRRVVRYCTANRASLEARGTTPMNQAHSFGSPCATRARFSAPVRNISPAQTWPKAFATSALQRRASGGW